MDLQMDILFPGEKRVDVRLGSHVIHTDQPPLHGGQDAHPAPFDLFLASIGACSGIFALGFCQARGLSTEGLALHQTVTFDEKTHLPTGIRLELTLPQGFPQKYEAPILRSIEHCTVKKALAAMPHIEVVMQNAQPVAAE